MEQTLAISPGTMTDDDTVGTVAWLNPDRAKVSDNSRCFGDTDSGITHYLKATNFGFAIPTGATIDGILVEVEKKSLNNVVTDYAVRIVKGGTIGSTDKSNVNVWSSTEAYISYGASNDLWGLSWTAENINLSTFGFVISAQGAADGAYVDHIRITVYYTMVTGPFPTHFNI